MDSGDGIEELYPYVPSLVVAVFAAALFLILFIQHLLRLYTKRTWFCIPFSIGAFFEIIGYIGRAQSSQAPNDEAPYLVQSVFTLIAPIFLAAPIYTFLERIIRSTGHGHYSVIRPHFLTAIFVAGDVVCFFMQMAGAALMGEARTIAKLDFANDFVLAGLVVQVCIFEVFLAVGIVFHYRLRKVRSELPIGCNWEGSLYWLYGVSTIITLRNFVRIVQCSLGAESYLMTTEWPVYIFDAVPMFLVLLVCNWWYVDLGNATDTEKDTIELLNAGSFAKSDGYCKTRGSTKTIEFEWSEAESVW